MDNYHSKKASGQEHSAFYKVYLIVVAMFGWGMASMNFNILTATLPAIRSSLHFSVAQAGILTSIIYAGMFIVSLIFGPIIDKLGRKLAFQVTLLVSAVFTGLTSLSFSFGFFATTRFIADGGSFAELPSGLTIVSEEVTKRYRGLLYGFVQGGWQIGLFLASGLYLLIGPEYGWRPVYLIGIIPLVVILIARLFIKESPRYEDLKNAVGNKDYKPEYKTDVTEARKFSYRQLFSKKTMKTGAWPVASYFVETLGFIPMGVLISLFFSGYFKMSDFQIASILTISAAIAYFAYPLSGWIGDVIGRKYGLILGLVLEVVFALTLIYIAKPGVYNSVLLWYILLNFATGMYAGNGFIYGAESYPTRVRGTGTAFLMAMVALGYLVGSLLFTLVYSVTVNYVTTWWITAIGLTLACLIITSFAPNVKRTQELEDITV